MRRRTIWRRCVLVLALTALSLGPGAVAEAATRPPTPDISLVEIQADSTTITLKWQPLSNVDGYEFYWRSASGGAWSKFDWAHEWDLNGSGVVTLGPKGSWSPQRNQAYQVTMVSKRYSDQAISDFATPATVTMNGSVTGLAVTADVDTAGQGTISMNWQAYPGPFSSYNFFVAATRSDLTSCYVGWAAPAGVVRRTVSSGCGGQALAVGRTYWAAIRAIQRQDPTGADPNVWTALSAAPVTITPRESIRTALVNGSWRIVDPSGNPVTLTGVSVRRSHSAGADVAFATRDQLSALRAKGFDTIRVPMRWQMFEPSQGQWSPDSFARLDQLVADAGAVGLKVILDPIHHVNGQNLPSWVWPASGLAEHPKNSRAVVARFGGDYLRYVTQRYTGYRQVVALDLVNEIREPDDGRSFDARMTDLMGIYHDLIRVVREVDPDKVLILQPYYGSTRVTGDQLRRISAPTSADPTPDPAHFTNLVWSIHDYYSGNLSGDGYGPWGTTRWGSVDARGMRAFNSWDSVGCYPTGTTAGCPDDASHRAGVLRPGMSRNLDVHVTAANAAGMPVLVGEFGLPHPGRRAAQGVGVGWQGGERYLDDKTAGYDARGLSRMYWAWSEAIDETYGLYDPTSGSWHSWTDRAVG